MPDPAALAASIVNVLMPLFRKALGKVTERVGENGVDALFQKLRRRLGNDDAGHALDELAAQPGDPQRRRDAIAALTKAIENEPGLAGMLQREQDLHHTQTVTGANHSTVIQVCGTGNVVNHG